MKRYEIQVDDLEIEPNAIFDIKTKTLYECRSSDMNELCKLLNKEDTKWQKLKEWILDIWKQDLSKELSNGSKYSTKHLIHPEKLLYKMQELEGEDEKN